MRDNVRCVRITEGKSERETVVIGSLREARSIMQAEFGMSISMIEVINNLARTYIASKRG